MSKPEESSWKGDAESQKLPIYQHRHKLIEAVKENQFLVVTGETGSGKTTQLPQYLHQAGELQMSANAQSTGRTYVKIMF